MSVKHTVTIILSTLALSLLVGCGGSKKSEAPPPPPRSSPSDYSSRLNVPNVPEAEKEQIRKAMGQSGTGSAPTSGQPAPTGGQ